MALASNAPRAPYINSSGFMNNSTKLLQGAINGANEIADRYETRQRNQAIQHIMGNKIDSDQSIEDFRQEQSAALSGVQMDPMKALGLVNDQVKPMQAQSNADRLFGQQADQNNINNAFKTGEMIQRNDAADATQTYRDNTLAQTVQRDANTKSYQQQMAVPTDIREMRSSGFTTEMTDPSDPAKTIRVITEQDFEDYQTAKAASSKQAYQSEETKAGLRSNALKRYVDMMNDDEYAAYSDLTSKQRQLVDKRLLEGKGSGYSPDTKSWYRSSDAGFNTAEAEQQDIPDGIRYVGNQAFDADGQPAPKYNKR